MNKSIINFILIAVITVSASFGATAQKFAHINSQLLLLEMPEVKTADNQITTYQETLMTKGKDMVTAFESKYIAYADQAGKGELNKIQMQQKEGELAKEQQAIQEYEVEVQNLLGAKREALYQPILEKVKNTIEAVGKDGGYTMIFDTSSGVLVHATESEDIMSAVKAKLGI